MSVPARRGPWWYYTRTEEGKSYAIHCRRPARGRDELPPAGEPGEEEQILLDENALAEGSEYFAVGQRRGQPRPPLAGLLRPTAPATRSTSCASGRSTPRPRHRGRRVGARDRLRPGLVGRRPTTCSTSAWTRRSGPSSSGATGWAPTRPATCSSSRRPTAASRSAPARPATPPSCSIGLHSTNTTEWLAIPSADPLAEPRGRDAAPRGRRVRGRPPHARRRAAGLVRGPDQRRRPGLPGPGRPRRRPRRRRTRRPGARWSRTGPGVRVEDVDAFARALVLSERAEAQTQVRVLPAARGRATPSPATCSARAGSSPPSRAPSSTWLGANPEPDAPALRIGRTSLVTPSSVLQIDARRPRGDAAQAGARPGRLRPGPLHHLPGVGRRPRRDAGPDLGGAPQGSRAARARASSTATAPTRSPSTRPSRTTASRCSTAASSSPSRTCAAAGRWAAPGTRTGGWSTRPTRSPTSSPAAATSSTPGSPGRARWPAGAARPAACSSAPWPTRRPSSSARSWPRCPSSTA